MKTTEDRIIPDKREDKVKEDKSGEVMICEDILIYVHPLQARTEQNNRQAAAKGGGI